jgi:hypothetical protein
MSRWILLRMGNDSEKSEGKIKTDVKSKRFLRKSCHLWNKVEKYGASGHATEGTTAHALCMLDTQGYKHKIRICNSYCFSTATMITGKRLNVTLYLSRLSCFFKKRQSLTLLMTFRNSSPPFLLLSSISTVRDIIWQYSLVSMFFPNGLLFSFLVVFLDSSSESLESSSCIV